ncbi:MAG: hypothetical protein HGA27_06250 [Peptococcaceae bacterium]|nr:hypothetical protein [Peptococcaceae bacterium]
MSGKIKSALEKALERADTMPQVSKESIDSIENLPKGRAIAGNYMNEEDFDLVKALSEVPSEVKKHILLGVQEVLLANIVLTGEDHVIENDHKAMEGIMSIKEDKPSAGVILSELDNLLKYYQQVTTQAMEKYKKEYEEKTRNNPPQNEQEATAERAEYQKEWVKTIRQIDHQFQARLSDLKARIKQVD